MLTLWAIVMTIVYMLPVIVQYDADSMGYSDDYSLYVTCHSPV